MPGPKPKYAIELTTEEEQSLRRLANSRTAAHGQVIRARILLAAHDRIEIGFGILQRKLLQPNHFERPGSLKQAIVKGHN